MALPIKNFVLVSIFAMKSFAISGDEIVSATGITQGLCVNIGVSGVSVDLVKKGSFVLHYLTKDKAQASIERKALQNSGMYGLGFAEVATTLPIIPYKKDLINLLIIDKDILGSSSPSDDEIKRVLIPEGMAYIKSGNSWSKITKAYPSQYDSWTHYDHGADGNPLSKDLAVGLQNSFRWASGTDNRGLIKSPGVRVDKGFLGHEFRNQTKDANIIGRDAFNGIPRWRMRTDIIHGNGGAPYIAADGKYFTILKINGPMVAIDQKSGKILTTFSEGGTWTPVTSVKGGLAYGAVYANNTLFQTSGAKIFALDASTGKLKWSKSSGAQVAYCPILDEAGKNLFVVGGGSTYSLGRWHDGSAAKNIVCYDANSGNVKWTNSVSSVGQILYKDGRVGFFQAQAIGTSNTPGKGKYGVIDAASGKTLWSGNYEANSSIAGYNAFMRNDDFGFFGCFNISLFDAKTGKDKSIPCGANSGCMRGVVTPNAYIRAHLMFVNNDLSWKLQNVVRPGCATGIFPGNGMIYNAPTSGCRCKTMYRAFMAYGPEMPEKPLADGNRVETGPNLFGVDEEHKAFMTSAAAAQNVITKEWVEDFLIQRMGDSMETAVTSVGGVNYLGIIHEHRLEARTGTTVKWSYTAGGRITLPPVVDNNKVYFGANDGYVYCLNASDGTPVWRFLAAPVDRRIVMHGQIESAWPVPNVVMHKGKVVAAAGRDPEVDGGIFLYGLNPADGTKAWSFSLFTPSFSGSSSRNMSKEIMDGSDNHTYNYGVRVDSSGLVLLRRNWHKNHQNGNFNEGLYDARLLNPENWDGKIIDIKTAQAVGLIPTPRSAKTSLVSKLNLMDSRNLNGRFIKK